MRPVNLIPSDERRRGPSTRKTPPTMYLIVGALVAVLVGVTAVVLTGNSITERKAQIEQLKGEEAAATARADSLRAFADFAATEQARTQTISSLAQSRFDWERVLRELALVIPPSVTLKTLRGTANPSVTMGTEATVDLSGEIAGPALSLSGCASGQPGVAELVAAIEDIDGVTRVGLSDSVTEEDTAAGGGDCLNGTTFNLVAAFDEATSSQTGGA